MLPSQHPAPLPTHAPEVLGGSEKVFMKALTKSSPDDSIEPKAVKWKWLCGPLLVRLLGQAGGLCVMLNPVVVLRPHLLLSSLPDTPSSLRNFLFLAP